MSKNRKTSHIREIPANDLAIDEKSAYDALISLIDNIDQEVRPSVTQKDHLGHRSRLRNRILKSKFGTTPEYELLEMVLGFAIKRADTKPLAKELIKNYGNISRILTLDPNILKKHKGIGDSVVATFRIIHEICSIMASEQFENKPIIESWTALIEYCRISMGQLKTEQFRILYLDSKNMVIADDLQEIGTVDNTTIYPREITKRALFLEASSVIMVHNHPSGNTKPSKSDIDATRLVVKSLATIGITLFDHLIISSSSCYSFRNSGLI